MRTMGKDPRSQKANQDPVAEVVAVVVAVAAESILETLESLMERAGNFHYPLMSVGDVAKVGTKKDNLVKLWKQFAEALEQGHYEKVCMKKSTHLVNVLGTSTNSEPDYFNGHGDPVYAHPHMVHVKETNQNKHLIQFPISTDFKKVRNSEEMCPTVLLKADTGADVNLMNLTTFDRVIGDRSALQPTSLKMEVYGNSTVEVLGKFHTFLRWKGRVYRQLFYVTTANASLNLLSRDSCYTLGVLKPCYSVETSGTSSRFQGKPQVKPTQPTTDCNQPKMHGTSSHHLANEGTGEEKLSQPTQQSHYKEQLQGIPLKKHDILRMYSDIFTGIGKFLGPPYKFQLKPNEKLARHALQHIPVHLQEAFHKEISNLEWPGILDPVKEVTEWVNNFVKVEKKVTADSNTEEALDLPRSKRPK